MPFPTLAARGLAGALVVLMAACASTQPGRDVATQPSAASLPEYQMPAPQIPERVPVVVPRLRVSLPGPIDDSVLQKAREVAGVAAVARVALSQVTLLTAAGPSEISVAAVNPSEFRPLAPEVTANAAFVWRKLVADQIVLAHEERRRLALDAGETARVATVDGETPIRVGAVAANGVPNLAGAMVSATAGRTMGVGEPRSLVIGLDDKANEDHVVRALTRTLGVKPDRILSPGGRAFATGNSSDKLMGSFRYAANADGTITQDPEWVRKYIVTKPVPILGRVTCHKAIFPQLTSALDEIQRAGLASKIDMSQFGGCYMPRFIARDANRPISMHAWGMALDINTVDNPQGGTPKLDPGIVEAFERWGFRWGGRWSPPDGHHFELAALITR